MGQFQAYLGWAGGWLLEHSVLMRKTAFSAKSQAKCLERPTTQSSRRAGPHTGLNPRVLVHAGCVKLLFLGVVYCHKNTEMTLLLSRSQLTHLHKLGRIMFVLPSPGASTLKTLKILLFFRAFKEASVPLAVAGVF